MGKHDVEVRNAEKFGRNEVPKEVMKEMRFSISNPGTTMLCREYSYMEHPNGRIRACFVLLPEPGATKWKFLDWFEFPDDGCCVRPVEYSELKDFVKGEASRIIAPDTASISDITPHLKV